MQAAAMLRNTTALRASAREFVPSGLKAAPPTPQPGDPSIGILAALPLIHPAVASRKATTMALGGVTAFELLLVRFDQRRGCSNELSLHIAL